MKFIIFSLLALGGIPLLAETAHDPISLRDSPLDQLESLISASEEHIERLKKLDQLLVDYLALQEKYLKDTNDRDLALQTAKIASLALGIIKVDHLTHLFEPSFISELTLFAKLAERPSLPKNP